MTRVIPTQEGVDKVRKVGVIGTSKIGMAFRVKEFRVQTASLPRDVNIHCSSRRTTQKTSLVRSSKAASTGGVHLASSPGPSQRFSLAEKQMREGLVSKVTYQIWENPPYGINAQFAQCEARDLPQTWQIVSSIMVEFTKHTSNLIFTKNPIRRVFPNPVTNVDKMVSCLPHCQAFDFKPVCHLWSFKRSSVRPLRIVLPSLIVCIAFFFTRVKPECLEIALAHMQFSQSTTLPTLVYGPTSRTWHWIPGSPSSR